jgi:hypothetical protein
MIRYLYSQGEYHEFTERRGVRVPVLQLEGTAGESTQLVQSRSRRRSCSVGQVGGCAQGLLELEVK